MADTTSAVSSIQESSVKDFLESVPPGVSTRLLGSHWGIGENKYPVGSKNAWLIVPELMLHCSQPTCGGFRFFDSNDNLLTFPIDKVHDRFLDFECRHCKKTRKTFAVRLCAAVGECVAFKLGEVPPFGAPLSARLLQLAGSNGSLLKKGRRCENQGLGVGAFAYYRRVVESQKARLIDELQHAITRLGANPGALAALEAARAEIQFTKAIKEMADVTPKELFVSGQNPLTLLHRPLSVGLHTLSDEECLKNANHVRLVLTALLERIASITEKEAELDAAVKELIAAQNEPATD